MSSWLNRNRNFTIWVGRDMAFPNAATTQGHLNWLIHANGIQW